MSQDAREQRFTSRRGLRRVWWWRRLSVARGKFSVHGEGMPYGVMQPLALALACVLLVQFAMNGCRSTPNVGKLSLGPRSSAVLLTVEIERVQSFAAYFSAYERVADDGELIVRPAPHHIDSVVELTVTVTAPTDEIAYAVASWWLGEVQNCNAWTAASHMSAPLTGCRAWGWRQLYTMAEPSAISQPPRPEVERVSESGGVSIAKVSTSIGVECLAEQLKLLTLTVPRPSRIESSGAPPWKRADTPHAPLTVPPYDTWRYESLSPMFQFVPVGASPGIPAPPHPPNGGVL